MIYTKDRFNLPSVEELWSHAVNESPPNPQGAVGKLVNFWAKTLNSEVVSFEEKEDEAPKSKDLHPEFLDVVVIDGNDIKKQFLSSKPYSVLFKLIVNQVRSSRLCPFDTTRPARGEMFRGEGKSFVR